MAKIIQVTTFFHPIQGGVEQQVLDLSRELFKKGHQVEVICSDSTRTRKKIKNQKSKIDGIKITRCKTWFSFSQFHKIYPKLFRLLLDKDFDIVHVHGFRKFETYPALLVAKLKKKKIILTTHNPFVTPTSSRGKILQFLVMLHDITLGKIFTRFIDHIICLVKSEIPYIEKFGVRREKISVIPNGIGDNNFKKGNPKRFAKKHKLPIKKFKNIVVYTGRIHRVKGLDNLETAIKQLKDTLFIFAGSDDDASYSTKQLYKSCPNVIFTGIYNNNELPDIFPIADLYVLPSLHEAFGIVILEAMAQQMPIISTNVGGPADIVKSEFGMTLNPKDQWAWMRSIKNLLKDKKKLKLMGKAARKEAEKYRWKNLVDLVLKVYKV